MYLRPEWDSIPDLCEAHVESWLRIAGHCASVGSTCWALLCKCTRLYWATHRWPRNKGNVEPCWAKSLTSFKFDSTPLNRVFKCAQSVELNMLRACTVDKCSAFARCLTWKFVYFSKAPQKWTKIQVLFKGVKKIPFLLRWVLLDCKESLCG